MGIEQESLGVPDEEESDVVITFSAKEFASIVNTLKEFSDSVRIDVDKNGVKFITNGDIGGGEVILKPREGNSDDDLDVGVDIKVRVYHFCIFAILRAIQLCSNSMTC